jgi:hypothetical protein
MNTRRNCTIIKHLTDMRFSIELGEMVSLKICPKKALKYRAFAPVVAFFEQTYNH